MPPPSVGDDQWEDTPAQPTFQPRHNNRDRENNPRERDHNPRERDFNPRERYVTLHITVSHITLQRILPKNFKFVPNIKNNFQ